jgi:hypothetical protein
VEVVLNDLGSAAGGRAARQFDRFGQASAHGPEDKRGHFALRSQRHVGSLLRKFPAAVQPQSRVLEKLSRETHIFGAVHTPKPQLLFLTLEEIQSLFQFFHRAIEGGCEKVDAKGPRMPGVVHLDSDSVFARLVAVDAAAVVVANGGSAGSHVDFTDLCSL